MELWSRIEADLPLTMELEAVDPLHPQTVALRFGPLVLFAMTDKEPVLTRAKLLAAKRTGPQTGEVGFASGPMKMLPFTAIDEEQYSTYLRLS